MAECVYYHQREFSSFFCDIFMDAASDGTLIDGEALIAYCMDGNAGLISMETDEEEISCGGGGQSLLFVWKLEKVVSFLRDHGDVVIFFHEDGGRLWKWENESMQLLRMVGLDALRAHVPQLLKIVDSSQDLKSFIAHQPYTAVVSSLEWRSKLFQEETVMASACLSRLYLAMKLDVILLEDMTFGRRIRANVVSCKTHFDGNCGIDWTYTLGIYPMLYPRSFCYDDDDEDDEITSTDSETSVYDEEDNSDFDDVDVDVHYDLIDPSPEDVEDTAVFYTPDDIQVRPVDTNLKNMMDVCPRDDALIHEAATLSLGIPHVCAHVYALRTLLDDPKVDAEFRTEAECWLAAVLLWSWLPLEQRSLDLPQTSSGHISPFMQAMLKRLLRVVSDAEVMQIIQTDCATTNTAFGNEIWAPLGDLMDGRVFAALWSCWNDNGGNRALPEEGGLHQTFIQLWHFVTAAKSPSCTVGVIHQSNQEPSEASHHSPTPLLEKFEGPVCQLLEFSRVERHCRSRTDVPQVQPNGHRFIGFIPTHYHNLRLLEHQDDVQRDAFSALLQENDGPEVEASAVAMMHGVGTIVEHPQTKVPMHATLRVSSQHQEKNVRFKKLERVVIQGIELKSNFAVFVSMKKGKKEYRKKLDRFVSPSAMVDYFDATVQSFVGRGYYEETPQDDAARLERFRQLQQVSWDKYLASFVGKGTFVEHRKLQVQDGVAISRKLMRAAIKRLETPEAASSGDGNKNNDNDLKAKKVTNSVKIRAGNAIASLEGVHNSYHPKMQTEAQYIPELIQDEIEDLNKTWKELVKDDIVGMVEATLGLIYLDLCKPVFKALASLRKSKKQKENEIRILEKCTRDAATNKKRAEETKTEIASILGLSYNLLKLCIQLFDKRECQLSELAAKKSKAQKKLSKCCKKLGFLDCKAAIDKVAIVPPNEEEEEFDDDDDDDDDDECSSSPRVLSWDEMQGLRHQLIKHPDELERPAGVGYDERVRSFSPDLWQQKLLDTVDARQSTLVIAPTSSGKTFACFYAMQRVLQESDDGVLMYVVPTRPLANQVHAEVAARFSKEYSSDRKVSGIFTSDYRINANTAQILVTVIQCADILMMVPRFVSRLRWVILDEVQCIGEDGPGAALERLIALSPAPIMALSATIRDPASFGQWFKEVEESKSSTAPMTVGDIRSKGRANAFDELCQLDLTRPKKVHIITHNARWNELYFSVMSKEQKVDVHPAWVMHPIIENLNPESDIRLLPHHMLSLFRHIKQYEEYLPKYEELYPGSLLYRNSENSYRLSTTEVLAYERLFKEKLLGEWKNIPELRLVLQKLCKPVNACLMSAAKPNAYSALTLLKEKQGFPALFCILNQKACVRVATSLADKLTEEENVYKSQLARNFMKRYQIPPKGGIGYCISRLGSFKSVLRSKLMIAIASAKSSPKNDHLQFEIQDLKGQLDGITDCINALTTSYAKYSAMPSGCFPPSEDDIEEFFPDFHSHGHLAHLYEALRRGIGVHHAALPKYYRNGVERMFRQKKLGLVICTSTFALGINMPARTVVFLEDSAHLTPVLFKQMSGRAGRRNFDNRGEILISSSFTATKLRRLLAGNLPMLQGNCAISPSNTLRLLIAHTISKDDTTKTLFAQNIQRMLLHPLSNFGKRELPDTFRFCMEVLRKVGLIDSSGEPMNIAGFVAHLFWTEPANFGLLYLLMTGTLNKVVESGATDMDPNGTVSLIALLARVFEPVHIPHARAKEMSYKTTSERNCSQLLPPIPRIVKQSLNAFNREMTQLTATFWSEYVQSLKEGGELQSDVLPLMEKEHVAASAPLRKCNPLGQFQNENCPVLSPFRTLKGKTQVDSLETLSFGARRSIEIDTELIPNFDIDQETNVSAYALAFYQCKNMNAVSKACEIGDNELWEKLYRWGQISKALFVCLKVREKAALAAGQQGLDFCSERLLSAFEECAYFFQKNSIKH